MNVRVDSHYMYEQMVCYAVVFDTGYFYIGATNKFNQRVKQHKILIKSNPENYLIGIKHSPKSCIIIKLLLCSVNDNIFRLERDLIMIHSNNPYLINKQKASKIVIDSMKKIKQTVKNLKKGK